MKTHIYPLLIIKDRYGGAYSGDEYIAWNAHLSNLPLGQEGDDCTCFDFWHEIETFPEKFPDYGIGETIEKAITDLENKLRIKNENNRKES